MRSILHSVFGDPAEVLSVADSSLPQPGFGEIRIRTLLAPIHNHDLLTVRGRYGYKPSLPAIGGSEAVGIIDALGEGVEDLSLGQRVTAASVHGTWAEFFLAPAKMAVPLPEAISDEAAAQLIAMPLSALMLLEFLNVQAGDWVVQNAANGAVGKTLAMLAAARGVHTINIVRRDSGVQELSELGIQNTVSTAQPDWKERVHAIADASYIRAGVDSIGGQDTADLLSLVGDAGLLVAFGSMTSVPMSISVGELIFRQIIVKGFWGSRVSESMSALDKRRLVGELIERVVNGDLLLPVQEVYDFKDIAQAAQVSAQPGRKGKVLLRA